MTISHSLFLGLGYIKQFCDENQNCNFISRNLEKIIQICVIKKKKSQLPIFFYSVAETSYHSIPVLKDYNQDLMITLLLFFFFSPSGTWTAWTSCKYPSSQPILLPYFDISVNVTKIKYRVGSFYLFEIALYHNWSWKDWNVRIYVSQQILYITLQKHFAWKLFY